MRMYDIINCKKYGETLTKEQMQTAFAVMQDNFQPFTATITEIGLAKVNPHEDVVRFEL